jgi:ABC-type multidrug transport system fused ATPase/permease subunit
MYSGITGFVLIAYSVGTAVYVFATVRAGRIVHTRLLNSLMASTFRSVCNLSRSYGADLLSRWLDTVPSSRIISRVTQDIQSSKRIVLLVNRDATNTSAVDGPLAQLSNTALGIFISFMSHLIAIAFSAPLFIIPGLAVGVCGGLMAQIYMKAQLSVKRERSNAKSPIVAEINGAFAGLVSIRAFGVQRVFAQQAAEKINQYTGLSVLFNKYGWPFFESTFTWLTYA